MVKFGNGSMRNNFQNNYVTLFSFAVPNDETKIQSTNIVNVIPAMSIKDKLSLLIEELQRHNSPVIPLLQNGLTQDEIDNVIKPLGLNFPGELYELYSWKNGIAEKFENIGRFPLFPTGIFLDFYSATKVYPKKEGKIKHWKKNKFPVFGMANEYYLIDIDNASNTYGVIYYYSGDEKTSLF